MAILPDNEYTEFEDRYYVNPQVALDEGNKFIDNLRSTQQTNNQQIRNQAYNLGKAVPSNLGGLVGGEGYFTSRYQTPQMTSLANNLRATNQANALKSVLENDSNAWKKRYTQAYQNYQKRSGGNNPTDKGLTGDPLKDGIVDTKKLQSISKFFGVPDSTMTETDTSYIYTDPTTGEKYEVSKEYMNTLYDKETGELTDDGAVILNVRQMLGL